MFDVCKMKNNLFSATAFNFPLNELIDWKRAFTKAPSEGAGDAGEMLIDWNVKCVMII